MVIDVWPINLDAAPPLPLHSHHCQLQERKRKREREIVSEQVSLVCSRATQPGEKSTEKSCERRVCQLKAYNSPQTTSEQTSSNSNNEQQQQQHAQHGYGQKTRQQSMWASSYTHRNRCTQMQNKGSNLARREGEGGGAGGARRFGHTSHVLPKGETTKHALQATPHNTLNWMLWLSANGIGIQIEMRREWDSMEAAKQLCILQCIAMWEICAGTAQREAESMQSPCEFRYII